MKHLLKYPILLLTITFFFSCSKNDSNQGANPRMMVSMTDAPGDFEEVLIDVQDIMINYSTDENNGWVSLANVRKGQYDLMKLTAGLDTLLVSADVSPGRVNQIRMVLGSQNFVNVDGDLIELKTPSAQQSGLKIKINQDLVAGQVYRVLLDFDVSKSVVESGNGSYTLKPVIRAVVEAQGGSIGGTVNPGNFVSEVFAINGTDTVGSLTGTDGAFLIRGLNAGTYTVVVQPLSGSGFSNHTTPNVTVTTGQNTDLGEIDL